MIPNTKALWKNPEHLAEWLDRNCKTCRRRPGGTSENSGKLLCPGPKLALFITLRDLPAPAELTAIVCSPQIPHRPGIQPPLPFTCHTRKDQRGRPAKEEETPPNA